MVRGPVRQNCDAMRHMSRKKRIGSTRAGSKAQAADAHDVHTHLVVLDEGIGDQATQGAVGHEGLAAALLVLRAVGGGIRPRLGLRLSSGLGIALGLRSTQPNGQSACSQARSEAANTHLSGQARAADLERAHGAGEQRARAGAGQQLAVLAQHL